MKTIVEEERARTSSIGLLSTPSKSKVDQSTTASAPITLGSFIVTPKKKSDVSTVNNNPWSNTPNKSNKTLSQIQEEEFKNSTPTNNNNNNAWFCVRPRAESLDAVISEQLVEKAIEKEKKSLQSSDNKKALNKKGKGQQKK